MEKKEDIKTPKIKFIDKSFDTEEITVEDLMMKYGYSYQTAIDYLRKLYVQRRSHNDSR